MANFRIHVFEEKCASCRRCILACAYLHTGSFNMIGARIRLESGDLERTIHFTDECIACGICADHCLFGALEKTREEAAV